jgi:hypothetical protein
MRPEHPTMRLSLPTEYGKPQQIIETTAIDTNINHLALIDQRLKRETWH